MLAEVTPAVVNMAVKSGSFAKTNPLYSDPFFRRHFNLPEMRQRLRGGSGVTVVAEKGYILTNHHVVANMTEDKSGLKPSALVCRLRDER